MKPPRKGRTGPRPSTPPVGPRATGSRTFEQRPAGSRAASAASSKAAGFAGREGSRGQAAAAKADRPHAPGSPAERPRFERSKHERPQADRPYADRLRAERPEQRGTGSRLELPPRTEVAATEAPRAEKPRYAGPGGPKRFSPRPERARAPEPQGEEAPRGSLWLFGTHAVAAALANPARRLRRLLLTEDAEAELASKLKQPWAISAERCDRARLDQLLGRGIVHQGAALLSDPLTMPSLAQALERPGPVLVLDQINDPRNVGAILRSAAAFGVACVISQDRNAPEETGTLAKAASGALEVVPMLRAVNIARTLVALRAAGLWIIGLDASGNTLSGPALANRRVALVLGSEGEGMRRLTRETCDEIAGIAMPGGTNRLDSLNVSAAATVALYEMARKA